MIPVNSEKMERERQKYMKDKRTTNNKWVE